MERGAKVRVLLELPKCEPIPLDARVVRSTRAFCQVSALAVAFRHRGDETEDWIQDAVLGALVRAQRPAVLLVDDDPCGARGLEKEIAFVGRRVVRVPTALDAVQALEDTHRRFDLSFVSAQLRSTHAREVITFLAEEYPHLRRVLVQRRPDGLLAGTPVDATLQAPWSRQRLISVLYAGR
jgi:CheY-like chemotaxis protein